MLGVILAGGEGKRFSDAGCCKPLLQINGRYLIEYALENLAGMRVSEVVVVVGRYEEQIRAAIGTCYRSVPVRYIRQEQPLGLVNALHCAALVSGREDVALQLGDEIFFRPDLSALERPADADFLCGYTLPEDPAQICENYAVICRGDDILFTREKPAAPLGEKKGTGFCVFSGDCMSFLRDDGSPEKENWDLCDFMNALIRSGRKGRAVRVSEAEININHPKKLILARRLMETRDE